ncbi:MAG: glycosyltransferase [Desulfobulbia bacterium]
MRILFTSTRGTGHLEPLLPFLHTLKRRGHDVCVAAPESVSEKLQKEELPHTPFDHPGDEQLKPIWARCGELPHDEANALMIREIFAGLNARTALPQLREIIHNWHPQLIVRESVEFAGLVAAEQAGVPHSRVAVHNGFVDDRFKSIVNAAIDILRQEANLSLDNGASLRAEPVFTAFPYSLDGAAKTDGKVPFRIGRLQDITISTQTAPAWAPKDGEKIVYITFGTIAASSSDRHAVYRSALSAIEGLPIRALLTTGPGMEVSSLGAIPGNVTVEAWVPQGEVWPHANALVCHGGSGTVLGGLAAGMPMVVIPLFADQPDNAQRIEEAGAGVAVYEPDVTSIRAAIERVLTDTGIHETSDRIAEEIASMPSVDDAVDVLLAPLIA